ncbi:MAG: YIP1 family protein [Sphingomonas sp.]|uniref:Yip1 family protein n=1 Tax=Sphingomonas sp. TaxID=28214 RepID=UPI001B250C0C|nr:Yip1 family protein [Sphingomonas sp.]MBO9624695.1 YIP1 family protein [Sphingomonas sp.]
METNGIIERAKNILLQPKPEWERVDAEPATIGSIYRNYVIFLAAIPAVAGFLGSILFGWSAFGLTYRPSIIGALSSAVIQYVLALVSVALIAWIINALAPTFSATRDPVQAFKVAAYSATASWVAGIFGLLPPIGWLSILGLYSLYLLYLGLPRLMKVPAEKSVPYLAAVIIVAVVVTLVLGLLAAPASRLFQPYPSALAEGSVSGNLSVPGVGSVDLGKLDAASKDLEAAAKRAEAGNANPPKLVDPAKLEALLPASIGGLARSGVESASNSVGGVGAASIEARYGSGDANAELTITDMAGPMGGLASLGAALNVESNQKTETGYERVGKVDGRMTTESWDGTARQGKYGVLVAERFMVEAEGRGVEMDALKAAVSAVNFGALEAAAAAR